MQPFRIIGRGTCGTVFEIPGTPHAYKQGPTTGIRTDFNLTNRAHNAVQSTLHILQDAFPDLSVPRVPLCHQFMLPSEEFWTPATMHRFPSSHRTKQAIFEVDRIMPLPQSTRELLIKAYFDNDIDSQSRAMSDPDNQDCLVRPYLGERETPEQQNTPHTSLRNFELRLNMLEEMKYNIKPLAKTMAIGLAVLHWEAQLDAMDTEFVLGSSAAESLQPGYADTTAAPQKIPKIDFTQRTTQMWMLDFDKATTFDLREGDVRGKLVPAFLGNDPYYPRPAEEDVWEWFCAGYLTASKAILKHRGYRKDNDVMGLPKIFLDEVTKVWTENVKEWDPEEEIVFG